MGRFPPIVQSNKCLRIGRISSKEIEGSTSNPSNGLMSQFTDRGIPSRPQKPPFQTCLSALLFSSAGDGDEFCALDACGEADGQRRRPAGPGPHPPLTFRPTLETATHDVLRI